MNDLTKYILFVFAKNDNPKEFTEQIAEELCVISDTPNLNFYFGPESSVFTISTLDSHEDVKDYVDMILDVGDIMYILLPYTSDNLSYGLPKKYPNIFLMMVLMTLCQKNQVVHIQKNLRCEK